MYATDKEISHLAALYEGRRVFYGELHDHAASGGTADGKRILDHWKGAMEALGLDFAAILDHKQVRHMYLPEWDDTLFICGTEPGTSIIDSGADDKCVHYNMIFPSPEPLMDLLESFPEFEFSGGPEGHFRYPKFTTERFCELIDAVKARGGFFVHPHPKQQMKSQNPLDYWFRDETGLEVFYVDLRRQYTADNYVLWTTLLDLGKRIWACAGGDKHACAVDTALTTIYAEEKRGSAYIPHLCIGDFVCGGVGIRMAIGDTKMGGKCDFTGKRLVLSVQDFHRSVKNPEHTYRVDLLSDSGVVFSREISCEEPACFAIDTEDVRFYRAEIFDVTQNLRIAIGNPIWNVKDEE